MTAIFVGNGPADPIHQGRTMSRESLGGVPVQLTTKRTSPAARSGFPAAQGLYSPENEHDACGVSFVAQIDGTRSHRLVHQAIGSLCNREHRPATWR